MATVVEGEASESDEEIEECGSAVVNRETVRGLSASNGGRFESPMVRSASDLDAISDLSSLDAVDGAQRDKFVIRQKYKSVFQKKLVEEMFYLRGQVETISNKSYADSTKQIRQLVRGADQLTASLKKSTYQLQLLTNDLFRLEDRVDEVNSMQTFSRLTLPASMTSAPSEVS